MLDVILSLQIPRIHWWKPNKIKQIEADEQTHVRSLVLSLAILLVPLHFPLSLYSKGRLVNF